MADSELATRAPENDAMEDSVIPGDSAAQSGASMGEHCTTDRPTGQVPAGEMSKFGDIDVYISKPQDYPQTPARLLLLLTGGTGVHSINNQIQADRYASHGYLVIMPDQFSGDAAPNSASVDTKANPDPPLLERIKLGVAETAKSFMLDMWLARHTPEKVLPLLHKVLDTAKDEYADAVAYGGGIYGAGYCFGAKYVIMLAGKHPDNVMYGQSDSKDEEEGMVSKGPLLKAGVIAHGTQVTKEDVCAIKSPLLMICVQNDQLFPAEILEQGRQYMEAHEVEHDIKIYPGVPHGFAVVGDYQDQAIEKAQASAFEQMLSWLGGSLSQEEMVLDTMGADESPFHGHLRIYEKLIPNVMIEEVYSASVLGVCKR